MYRYNACIPTHARYDEYEYDSLFPRSNSYFDYIEENSLFLNTISFVNVMREEKKERNTFYIYFSRTKIGEIPSRVLLTTAKTRAKRACSLGACLFSSDEIIRLKCTGRWDIPTKSRGFLVADSQRSGVLEKRRKREDVRAIPRKKSWERERERR